MLLQGNIPVDELVCHHVEQCVHHDRLGEEVLPSKGGGQGVQTGVPGEGVGGPGVGGGGD